MAVAAVSSLDAQQFYTFVSEFRTLCIVLKLLVATNERTLQGFVMPALLAATALSTRLAGDTTRPLMRNRPPAAAARWIRAAPLAAAIAAAGASRTAAASAADEHEECSMAVFHLVDSKWEFLW